MVDRVICGRWDWSRNLVGPVLLEEFREMLTMCQQVLLEPGKDKIFWSGDPSGEFAVSNLKIILVEKELVKHVSVFEWNNWNPKKVGFVAWRAVLNRLLTFEALARRSIPVSSTKCPVCGMEEESADHILFLCEVAQAVWCLISQWFKVPPIYAFRVQDLVELHRNMSAPKDKAKAFHAVCLVTMWWIWKKRNDLVHNGASVHFQSLFEVIKSLSYLWIKIRSKKRGLINLGGLV
ncbi:uncharacterized protein LOC143590416 [Bidens hawaiensis]|uniref:uncharacterized protein LOC143590416 n=1 Tax=Bidens hawaiensis TaxID=980011 RepID=UPI00404A518F